MKHTSSKHDSVPPKSLHSVQVHYYVTGNRVNCTMLLKQKQQYMEKIKRIVKFHRTEKRVI